MKQLRWMKTKIGLFGDPKVMAMLSQRHGETYFVVWFLLKDIAGTVNCDGYTCLSEQVPLTGEYIARVLRRRRDVVEKALDFLEQIDLISREKKAVFASSTGTNCRISTRTNAAASRRAAAWPDSARSRAKGAAELTAVLPKLLIRRQEAKPRHITPRSLEVSIGRHSLP